MNKQENVTLVHPEQKEFIGKNVLITGGSSGIGLAAAKAFSEEGANVVVLDIGEKPDFLPDSSFRRVDVSDWTTLEVAVNEAVQQMGGIDIVVNNAAVKISGSILEVSSKDFENLLRINGLGFWNVAKAVLPHLIKSKGTLVNVCSGTTEDLPPNTDAYFGSKGVTYSLTHALASSFKDSGMRVLGIAPGPVDTPLWRVGRTDASTKAALEGHAGPKVLQPEDIADMILSLASTNNTARDGKIYRYM